MGTACHRSQKSGLAFSVVLKVEQFSPLDVFSPLLPDSHPLKVAALIADRESKKATGPTSASGPIACAVNRARRDMSSIKLRRLGRLSTTADLTPVFASR